MQTKNLKDSFKAIMGEKPKSNKTHPSKTKSKPPTHNPETKYRKKFDQSSTTPVSKSNSKTLITRSNSDPIIKAKRVKLLRPNKEEQITRRRIRDERITIEDGVSTRISKVLSMSGVGSRRACDELVKRGVVIVNGKIATLGQQINQDNKIIVLGKPVI